MIRGKEEEEKIATSQIKSIFLNKEKKEEKKEQSKCEKVQNKK